MTTKIKSIFIPVGLLVCMLTSCNRNPGETKSEKIEYIMNEAVQEHQFVGNVLVVDSGRVVYKKSNGKANAALGISNSDSTKFLIASLSKPFTATLILKLIEEGTLNAADGLAKFFPTAKNTNLKKVTIHHLLTHTSGMKEFITKEHVFEENDLHNIEFNFDPGSDFEYSNSGYILLKKIAEISSGKTYTDLISQLIFTPLQMTSSGVARNIKTITDLAVGYKDATQNKPDTITFWT